MHHFLLFSLFLLSHAGWSLPPKKGTSICFDQSCEYKDIPLGMQEEQKIKQKSNPVVSPDPILKEIKIEKHRKPKKNKTIAIKIIPQEIVTNLPSYYQGYQKTSAKQQESVMYVPPKLFQKLEEVHIGDVFQAVIEQELEVSSQVKQPIRALLITGPYPRGMVLGEASLDLELKRVLLNFNQIRLPDSQKVFQLKAVGLSQNGTLGIKGEYHSDLGTFFIAETLSAFAAGMLDSTIQRNQNAFGAYTTEPSLGNSAKTGAVTALSKTTDRFAEKVKNTPESTTVTPWQEIKIMIQEIPTQEL